MKYDVEYYIGGTGIIGEKVCYHFDRWIHITGFIDLDIDKQKSSYWGKPAISLDKYLQIRKKNPDTKVIIAVLVGYQALQDLLEKNNIHDYYNFIDCPQEFFSANLNHIYESHILKKIQKGTKYVIYGKSIYSIVVNEWVKCITGKSVDAYDNLEECIAQENCSVLLTVRTKENKNIERIVDVYNCICEIKEYHNNRLEEFKDCNKGKRCFIIGLGPSLKIEDLNVLHKHNEISISMNSINKAFNDTKWRPQYYAAIDSRIEKDVDIDELDIQYKIIGDSSKNLAEKPHDDSVYISHVISDFSECDELQFSDDFAQYCSAGGTVTYACIQLAV